MTHYSKENKSRTSISWTPVLMAIILAVGVLLGMQFNKENPSITIINQENSDKGLIVGKVDELIRYIDAKYLEDLERDTLVNNAINRVLSSLDPHSSYIDNRQLIQIEHRLNGSYKGIGLEFLMNKDTILITNVLESGPAKSNGFKVGDKILQINDVKVSGVNMKLRAVEDVISEHEGDAFVIDRLSANGSLISAKLLKEDIALPSVEEGVLISDSIGYIKVNHFAQKTYYEFMTQLDTLSSQGLKHLVLDLRQNPGGYLTQATKILDQLFNREGRLLVYTEGRTSKRKDYFTTGRNLFDVDQVAVLIDEGSASASEIIAGAIQDNDRGVLIGSKSYGKGLVQEQYNLSDGSALRLTVARYFTPSGRSIQRPYKEVDKEEVSGDTVNYFTSTGRIVSSGGGIVPDLPIENQFMFKKDMFGSSLLSLFYASNKKQIDLVLNLEDPKSFLNENLNESIDLMLTDFIAEKEERSFYNEKLDKLKDNLKLILLDRSFDKNDLKAYFVEQDAAIQKAVSVVTDIEQMDIILGY